MRVLVTTPPELGHILPLLPLAVRLAEHGHELRWLVAPPNADVIRAGGLDVVVTEPPARARQAAVASRFPNPSALAAGGRAAATGVVLGELAGPRMWTAGRDLARRWRPDLVVHDAAELGAPLVAAELGVPSACHAFGDVLPELALRAGAERMAHLWRHVGLAPDRDAGCYRGLYLDVYPRSLRGHAVEHVGRVQPRRPAEGVPATGTAVHVTFGTVFNRVTDVFRAAVRAAAELADEVVVTVGPTGRPEQLGRLPGHVVVERFVPQRELLGRCAAVICHGGSGTVLAALAHGVPVVCIPQAADQFVNAGNVARAGAGTMVAGRDADLPALRGALADVLGSPARRIGAGRVAADIASMPSDEEVVEALEHLVSSWVPGHRGTPA